MRKKFIIVTACALTTVLSAAIFCSCHKAKASENNNNSLDTLVNPFIGTDFTGNTYPGAQAPHGMVQLSPDNGLPGWDRIAGYFYPDSTIAGFSHTHLSGTGAGDLYDISFLPVTLPYKESPAPLGVNSKFLHASEKASAGYYKVTLEDYNIDVELTATERVGVQRYTFPGGKCAVLLNLAKAMNWDATIDTKIQVVDSVTIKGYRFSNGWARNQEIFFVSRFSKPFNSVDFDTIEIKNDKDEYTGGKGIIAQFNYDMSKGEQLTISTAISGVDEEGALKNLIAETDGKDFDTILAQTKKQWNDILGTVKIEGGTHDDQVNFYTALYHSLIAPTIYGDVDGRYRGPDKEIHNSTGWTNYSTFSLWDTYRAAHPLYTIVEPDKVNSMVKSLMAFGEQNGRLPVWNMQASETDMMIGYHAVPVIVDAYLKGIADFDAEKALELCVATANINDYRGIGLYKEKGYVPFDVVDPYNADDWSLSRTLEYAYDDYCIALMAEKLGKKDIAKEFFKRSENYKNVFNPSTRFMTPRDSKGEWQTNFSPDEYTAHICESNGWHYLWSVQQDIPSLMKLLGGKDAMTTRLDSMFTYTPMNNGELPIFSTGMIGQYAHGNEPSHHVIYLYNYVDQPWKTAEYATKVMKELYRNEPAGLCGNEDMGQTSAWFVLSSMGFYPVDPVSGKYEIGKPLFEKVEIMQPDGKTFRIIAPEASKMPYVKSVKLNGKPYKKSYITHDQISQGSTFEFEMTDKPGEKWY